ncbi:MAG: hypothetical protein OHK0052_24050 [Anaerolineales bacterium]
MTSVKISISIKPPTLRNITRTIWTVLSILTLSVYALALFSWLGRLDRVDPQLIDPLRKLGILPEIFNAYLLSLEIVTVLVFTTTAVVLFCPKSDDQMIALVSLTLLTFPSVILQGVEMLIQQRSIIEPLIIFLRGLGIGSFLLVFYLFPTGQFVPRWTRNLGYVWVLWVFAWLLTPQTVTVSYENWPGLLRSVWVLLFRMDAGTMSDELTALYGNLRFYSLVMVMLIWFGSGIFAQIYRYAMASNQAQRLQTKWVIFGFTATLLGFAIITLLPRLYPMLQQSTEHILYLLASRSLLTLFYILTPLSIAISILRFRLWDIDYLINRTLVYGALTTFLGLLYLGSVVILQSAFRQITGQRSVAAVTASTLVIAILSQPLRKYLQNFIDRLFFREKINLQRALSQINREVHSLIDVQELLRLLTTQIPALLHIQQAAVYLFTPQNTLNLAYSHNLNEPAAPLLNLSKINRLRSGVSIPQINHPHFDMLVPLIATRASGGDLVGILALGPRQGRQFYTREDRTLLAALSEQAGMALYIAQLAAENEAETHKRQQIERQLLAYRESPAGKAEELAQKIASNPQNALDLLCTLNAESSRDPQAHNLLRMLPQSLENLGHEQLAVLAEGMLYIYESQYTPELLPAGLRNVISLLQAHAEDWTETKHALQAYRKAQQALEANAIPQIVDLLQRWESPDDSPITAALQPAAEALSAYERVDNIRDKLAYLASAVERLRHADYHARTELNGAERAILQNIANDWLAIVTAAMADLQTRAQLTCALLTRNTWQNDVISLVLSLRNDGRGAALNLSVRLADSAEYSLVSSVAKVERLAPTEEVQVQLRIRPHTLNGANQLRVRFVILYTDPRGPDQVENFADVVRLIPTDDTTYTFIPNPYVVGTPLQTNSPLFFGRDDVFAFIQQNLSASHRNNLVLIGQRRTGKTSLLKQLPARLSDDYLPVYLDGQSLGLDPGLPAFFLNFATEIAFALEDRGFPTPIPEPEDFSENPAATFEKTFLQNVRTTIGQRHLLILLDEFEELEAAVARGSLDASIFGFLRHIIQHIPNLSVIFCGTHRIEELAASYWSVLFNISLYRHIAFLERQEAFRLIQEPVKAFNLRYDDLALDKMWRVTAGHPYFLQLLCHATVNLQNQLRRSYVTISDVNAALDDILASGEAHFLYLWSESAPAERLVLTALSRMIPLTGHATPIQITDYLAERGVSLERQQVREALHKLTLRDILTAHADSDSPLEDAYHWKLGLLGLWVEKYRSLSRVADDAGRESAKS